ncbi:PREDICTED: tenascin-like isoform X2 [Priapulus caudatus]|nr:PREDICTED: tenascin-like isoform X2 [Priapulus caudatus]
MSTMTRELTLLITEFQQTREEVAGNITDIWQVLKDQDFESIKAIGRLNSITMELTERQATDHKQTQKQQGMMSALVDRLSLDLTDLVGQYRHNLPTLELVSQQGAQLQVMGEQLDRLRGQVDDVIAGDDWQHALTKRVDDNSAGVEALAYSLAGVAEEAADVVGRLNYSEVRLEGFKREVAVVGAKLDVIADDLDTFENSTSLDLEGKSIEMQLQASRREATERDVASLFTALDKLADAHEASTADVADVVDDVFRLRNTLREELLRINETERDVDALNSSVRAHIDRSAADAEPRNRYHSVSSLANETADGGDIFGESRFRASMRTRLGDVERRVGALQATCERAETNSQRLGKILLDNSDGEAGDSSGDGDGPFPAADNVIPVDALELWKAGVDTTLTNLETTFSAELASLAANVTRVTSRLSNVDDDEEERDTAKAVSGLEFSLSQMQTALDVLQIGQAELESRTLSHGDEVTRLASKVRADQYNLVDLQNTMFNYSLQACRDVNENLQQNLKISNVEVKYHQLENSLEEQRTSIILIGNKVNAMASRSITDELSSKLRSLRTEVDSAIDKIPKAVDVLEALDHQVAQFVYQLPEDCSMRTVPVRYESYSSGVYLIKPNNLNESVRVFCDVDEAGDMWTVIQRRLDGSVDFYRTWTDYRDGFGTAAGEYWLGNEHIHAITRTGNYSLRVDMWDADGTYRYATYEEFSVADAADDYRLQLNGYGGNATDAMMYHSNMRFSTRDRDNDVSSSHCARFYQGGWWYTHCQTTNLNGEFKVGMTWFDRDTNDWTQLAKVVMKVRPI